jgi:hypothetical protein
VVPVAKSIALAARIAIERVFIWITERYYRVKVTFSPPDRLRRDGSRLGPFERTRAEIEFVSGLLVGGARSPAISSREFLSDIPRARQRYPRPSQRSFRKGNAVHLAYQVGISKLFLFFLAASDPVAS